MESVKSGPEIPLVNAFTCSYCCTTIHTQKHWEREEQQQQQKEEPRKAISQICNKFFWLYLFTQKKQEKKVCPRRNCGQIPLELQVKK